MEGPPFRVLFLSQRNSARSMIAEAIANSVGGGQFQAFSAGVRPAPRVDPMAAELIEHAGLPIPDHPPQHVREFSAPDSPPLGDAEFEGERGILRVEPTGDVTRNGDLVWRNEVGTGYRGDSVFATQRHFIDCLRSVAQFETSAEDYLETFSVVEAAYRSASESLAS